MEGHPSTGGCACRPRPRRAPYAATLLIEQSVNIRVVQEVLGHTRVTTTERYTHVSTPLMRDAGERLASALWE
ncbi:tyrosine-type recombinase/integrase [Nonomuraea dietziae]